MYTRIHRRWLLPLLAALALPGAEAAIRGSTQVGFILGRAVFAAVPPGRPDELFVVEQRGVIWRLDLRTETVAPQPFLNISSEVDDGSNEQGLLGLAFHPDFASNGQFFVNYTRDPGPGLDRTRIERYTVANPLKATTAAGAAVETVLEFEQPFSNHNGGWIGFGPLDGYLYIAAGDGGSGYDPDNRGQLLNTLLGKILRIDVDDDEFPADPIRNYAIPPTNPFVSDGAAATLGEIWAYGLRNPWRGSFDRETGDLWMGDVGQLDREEIDFQPADSTGGSNYGWRLREGDIQTPGGVGGPPPAAHVGPVYDYRSDISGPFAGNSVVGGYVYRGPDPELRGLYFFADSFPKQLWTFDPADPDGTVANVEALVDPSGRISTPVSFAEDTAGNLYILSLFGGIFRIDTDGPPPQQPDELVAVPLSPLPLLALLPLIGLWLRKKARQG